ncbi:MAG: TonB-dependent receptor [Pseudohongiella sp.]|nr:TonB-dependent receptor [Pseudohongiella sp.]MDO9522042.1 TonB-dependent receptor [Pseudohongiella sp.]MDP2128677.1 TonB-dependent receptor [Pseudohongiella sp.]
MNEKKSSSRFPALVATCSLACLLPVGVSAQNSNDPTAAPREMLVTANRFAQFSHEMLNAHTLLDRDFINQSGASSLFDLLRTVPGVQLARTGTDGAQTSLFMRGSNSNHTLILLDGVRMNTASEGAARLENIPLSHIERIEVIRGPQSSVYGADAIGGVIQIFSRNSVLPSENLPDAGKPYSGRIEAGVGTEQSRVLHSGFRARLNQTVIDVDLSHRETDGIPAQNAPRPSTRDAGWENQSVSLGVQQALSNSWQLWGRWQATESEKLFDGGDSDASQRTGSAGLRGQISERWHTQLQVSQFKDNNLTRQYGLSRSTTRRDSLQWQNELKINDHGNTMLGLDIDDEDLFYLSSGAVQNVSTRRNDALFAVHQQELGAIDLTASVRLDDNEQFGAHSTGRLAVGTDLSSNSSIWVAASTAFKAPTLVDLYVDFPAFGFFANPDLEPERARNLEAGLRTNVADTALDINVFRNDIRDLIGSDSTFRSLTNVSRARIHGLELSASRDILGWQSRLSLTVLDHENRDTGQALLRRPNEQLSVSASKRFEQFSVFFDWQLRSDQADLDPVTYGRSRVGGYGVLDTVFEWQVIPALDLQLKIGNVFDKNYEVVDGFNTLGRHAMLSARHQF